MIYDSLHRARLLLEDKGLALFDEKGEHTHLWMGRSGLFLYDDKQKPRAKFRTPDIGTDCPGFTGVSGKKGPEMGERQRGPHTL